MRLRYDSVSTLSSTWVRSTPSASNSALSARTLERVLDHARVDHRERERRRRALRGVVREESELGGARHVIRGGNVELERAPSLEDVFEDVRVAGVLRTGDGGDEVQAKLSGIARRVPEASANSSASSRSGSGVRERFVGLVSVDVVVVSSGVGTVIVTFAFVIPPVPREASVVGVGVGGAFAPRAREDGAR